MLDSCPSCGASPEHQLPIASLSSKGVSVSSDSRYCKTLTGSCNACIICNHCYNNITGDLKLFYEEQYSLLLDSSAQDQILFMEDGTKVGRSVFQANLLHRLIDCIGLNKQLRILELGAGKGLTAKSFLQLKTERVKEYTIHEMATSRYDEFWSKISDSRVTTTIENYYDVVVSFFTLEHCPISQIEKSYLRYLDDTNILLLTVPDALLNPGDMLVIDHVSHFAQDTIERLFRNQWDHLINFAVSSAVYPRSLTVLISSKANKANLREILDSLEILDVVKDAVGNIADVQKELGTLNRFLDEYLLPSSYALWGASFYAKFMCLKLAEKPKVLFDSNTSLCDTNFIYVDNSCAPIEHTSHIIEYCKTEGIDTIVLALSPAAGQAVFQQNGPTMTKNGINLINPWMHA